MPFSIEITITTHIAHQSINIRVVIHTAIIASRTLGIANYLISQFRSFETDTVRPSPSKIIFHIFSLSFVISASN